MRVQRKSIFRSWTLWFNVLTLLSVMLSAVQNQDLIVEHPTAAAWIASAIAAVNIALRFKTNSPVKVLP